MLTAYKVAFALILCLAFGSYGNSQQPVPIELESSQPQQPKTATSQQQASGDQRGTDNDPFIVKVIPTPKTNEETAQEAKDRDEKTANDREIVRYARDLDILTAIIIAVGVLQLLVFAYQAYKLRQTVESSEKAIAVTRMVGEAQVRAYVSIKSAAIYFGGDDAMPFVEIVAVNSGQSPALNFVWVPQIYYLPKTTSEIVSEVDEKWDEEIGLDIHSDRESKALYIAHDFAMVEKITVGGRVPEQMGVSIIIHYVWADVFGKTFFDVASFAGVAEKGSIAENRRIVHDLNTSPWSCRLNPIAKGQAWTGILIKAPKEKATEKNGHRPTGPSES